jgi:transposase
VKAARESWRQNQPGLDGKRLVFIDETGLNTKMTRLYGRSLRNQRCVAHVPHGHWQSTSMIAGSVDAQVFTAYLQQVLCPELRPGDIVILDNLSTHKIAAVKTLVEARGASVHYLPAYSPDFNPIEMAFAKLKAHLRQSAARTSEHLQTAVTLALTSFQPSHCTAFFRHANYVSI